MKTEIEVKRITINDITNTLALFNNNPKTKEVDYKIKNIISALQELINTRYNNEDNNIIIKHFINKNMILFIISSKKMWTICSLENLNFIEALDVCESMICGKLNSIQSLNNKSNN